jgi:hypothetical protein
MFCEAVISTTYKVHVRLFDCQPEISNIDSKAGCFGLFGVKKN